MAILKPEVSLRNSIRSDFEILSPERRETNFATVPNNRDVVEYALKLAGDDERSVYLPIDSKFPLDVYARLMDAYDNGDNDQIQRL